MPQTSKPTPVQDVSAVIIKNDAVLLVKRGKPPLMNSWHLPGGKIEDGEDSKDAIAREVHEETGLTFQLPILLGEAMVSGNAKVSGNDDEKTYHYAIKTYSGEIDGAKPQAGSDASEARFVPLSELNKYDLSEQTHKFIDSATCHPLRKHPLRKHSVKGHLKTALIALFFGLAAYGFLFALMKILRATGFQAF